MGHEQNENFIILDKTHDADKVLLWENDLHFEKVKKTALYDSAILEISQYHDNIISWGLWQFPPILPQKCDKVFL